MTDRIQYEKNNLCIEDIPAADLAEKYGTPLYVYSKNRVTEKFEALRKAFHGTVDIRILYALKANSNTEILKHIQTLGAGADTVSAGEIFLALKNGFRPECISLAGAGKTDGDINFGLARNIGTFIVESTEELHVISKCALALNKTARVLLRINPDVDARTHPHISTGLKENKFGINMDHVENAAKLATKLKNVEFAGLHCHIGSQITEVEPFTEAAESFRKLATKLEKSRIRVKQIDLGGGIGVQYRNAIKHKSLPLEKSQDTSIDLRSLAEVIKENLSFPGCELTIEPGRFLVAEAGVLLTRVLYKKVSSARTFVVVDAGMNDMMRHALYSAYHQIVPTKIQKSKIETVDIVGPVCESTDAFAIQRKIPSVKRGDLLAIMTTGAYGFSLASNYNSRLKPAEILVDKDYARVIRDRQTYEDLV
jgi:diaminopimelate decarboxylase